MFAAKVMHGDSRDVSNNINDTCGAIIFIIINKLPCQDFLSYHKLYDRLLQYIDSEIIDCYVIGTRVMCTNDRIFKS